MKKLFSPSKLETDNNRRKKKHTKNFHKLKKRIDIFLPPPRLKNIKATLTHEKKKKLKKSRDIYNTHRIKTVKKKIRNSDDK